MFYVLVLYKTRYSHLEVGQANQMIAQKGNGLAHVHACAWVPVHPGGKLLLTQELAVLLRVTYYILHITDEVTQDCTLYIIKAFFEF